jgi:hypothetical protein
MGGKIFHSSYAQAILKNLDPPLCAENKTHREFRNVSQKVRNN